MYLLNHCTQGKVLPSLHLWYEQSLTQIVFGPKLKKAIKSLTLYVFTMDRTSFGACDCTSGSILRKKPHRWPLMPCYHSLEIFNNFIFEFGYISEFWWTDVAHDLDSHLVLPSGNMSLATCSPTQQLLPPSTSSGGLGTRQNGSESWERATDTCEAQHVPTTIPMY